ELEINQNGTNLICKYSRQDDQLRVVANIMGTTQALYYRVIDSGLQDKDGLIFYDPAHFQAVDDLAAPRQAVTEHWRTLQKVYQRRHDTVRTYLREIPPSFERPTVAAIEEA